MADKEKKKKLITAYKERSRTQTGGVYIISNNHNGKLFIDASADIEAAKNRFNFAQQTGACIHIKLSKDWALYGSNAFTFETAETIDKNEDQEHAAFIEDLTLLKTMWIEKYDTSELY